MSWPWIFSIPFCLWPYLHFCSDDTPAASHCRDVALFHGICGNPVRITANGNSPSYVACACLLRWSVDRRAGTFQMHLEIKLQIPYHMQSINIWLTCSHRCLRLLMIDYWSFMSQNYNMIMRDAAVGGSENLDHLGKEHALFVGLTFCLQQNAAAAARIRSRDLRISNHVPQTLLDHRGRAQKVLQGPFKDWRTTF